jgi:hypothetical protein
MFYVIHWLQVTVIVQSLIRSRMCRRLMNHFERETIQHVVTKSITQFKQIAVGGTQERSIEVGIRPVTMQQLALLRVARLIFGLSSFELRAARA